MIWPVKNFMPDIPIIFPGIGIDLTRIVHMNADEVAKKKEQLHLPDNQWIFLSSGEFIKRKITKLPFGHLPA